MIFITILFYVTIICEKFNYYKLLLHIYNMTIDNPTNKKNTIRNQTSAVTIVINFIIYPSMDIQVISHFVFFPSVTYCKFVLL